MILKYCMEIWVLKYIDEAMKNADMCTCERCRLDTIAITLNKLPPKYIVAAGSIASTKIKSLELQYDAVIRKEAEEAAFIVKRKNRHDL